MLGLLTAQSSEAQESNHLIHNASEASITGSYTQIDDVTMNDKVFLYPLLTHNFNPGGGAGVYHKAPVTVARYDKFWRIITDDKSAFTTNSNWNIFLPGADFNSWAHVSSLNNITKNYTFIDHPSLNGNPNAKLFVSKLFSSDGSLGKLGNHTVGVFYSITEKKWAIYNQDKVNMEEGMTFSVVFEGKTIHNTFVHKADPGNTNGHITIIDDPACNGNPNVKILITQNYNPNGSITGVYNDHEVGVYYNGTKWAIYNEDKVDLAAGAAFNVLVVNEETASTINEDLMNIPSLRVSPNPVNAGDQIKIDLYNESSEALSLEVMDMSGKSVFVENIKANGNVVIHHVSTAGLQPGMYMIRVSNARIAAVRRLIVN